MVSSILVDALSDPSGVISSLFDSNSSNFPSKVHSHFSLLFNSKNAFEQIPTLDVHHPPSSYPDRSLVRFSAMVQDTSSSPELYLAIRGDSRCGGWGLYDDDDPQQVNYDHLKERLSLWAVTIPGQTPWSKSSFSDDPPHTAPLEVLRSHKFPSPDTQHLGVQIKIYTENAASVFRPTGLFDLIGILTHELLHTEIELASPVSAPTLHVLFYRPLPRTIIPRVYPLSSNNIHDLRRECITWVAEEALAGDVQAAEWILLCLTAQVQSRHPPLLPPSLTITNFPSPHSITQSTPALLHVLELLFPLVSILPLTLELLNTTSFSPESKNEDLYSGRLQLPSGSIVIATEAGVQEGNLVQRGLENLHAMQHMMRNQLLEYLFPFSQFSFETDACFLVLAEGKKSAFFETSLRYPLAFPEDTNRLYRRNDEINRPSPEKLDAWRKLLGSAAVGHVAVDQSVSEYIQNDFVKMRQESQQNDSIETVTPDTLIHLMNIARLLALSTQSSNVTTEIWEQSKILDANRRRRLL